MGFSIWQLLIVLLVVVVLFGTKKLRNLGTDLGEAVKGFKKGVHDEPGSAPAEPGAIESTAEQAGVGGAKPETSEAGSKGAS